MFNENYYPYNYPKKNNILSNFKNIKLSTILDGTQKTLSIINQAIPIIYQIKPIYQNVKTAFKVVNAFKSDTNKKEEKKENTISVSSNNGPVYFI